MVGKKTLRITAAAVLAGTALGAQAAHGATPRQAPKAAGTVVITDWQTPDGCGPAYGGTVVDAEVCNAVLDGPYAIDNNAHYIPQIFSNLPSYANGDAKIVGGNDVITYRMKPGLKWSDGQPITMNDYKFSIAENIDIGNTFGLDQIKSVDVLNATTARVTMNGPYAPDVAIAEAQPAFFVPQHYLEAEYKSTDPAKIAVGFGNDLYNKPTDVVSGPYKFQTFASDGSTVVLVPNPYYKEGPVGGGHQPLAQIKYVNISANAAALDAALAGNPGVDKAEDFQANDLPLLAKTPYHIINQPSLEYEHLEVNSASLSKPLRQALYYAVDSRSYIRQLFPTLQSPDQFLLHSVVPNVSPWADTQLPLDSYNVAKAKALLAAAGYANTPGLNGKHLTVRFYSTNTPIRKKSGQILAKFWNDVGINTVQNYVSGSGNNGLFSSYVNNGILHQRRFDVAEFAFSIPPDPQSNEQNVDPSLIPTAAHHGSLAQNYVGADAYQFSILKSARYARSPEDRHRILNQWQSVLRDDAYFVPLYNRANIIAIDSRIGNFKANPTSFGNEWNAFEWYAAS